MKLSGLRWVRYRIPLVGEFVNSRGSIPQREGLIVWLRTDDGVIGIGEGSPLLEFGGGTAVDAERVLRSVARLLIGAPLEGIHIVFDSLLGRREGALAVSAALDAAALDARGTALGKPVARLLGDDPVDAVPVNAVIGAVSASDAAREARKAVEAGFTTVKLKVGTAPTLRVEVDRVAAVRDAVGPDVALRIDANGAWLPDQAIAIIRALTPYNIELVEQPVAGEQIVGLARVRRAVDVPIAADETVVDYEAARRLIESEAADVLIIKPTVLGGPNAAHRIIRLVAESDLRAVITTSFDTGIGVASALHLAATLPEPIPACGLATAAILESDLLCSSLQIHGGQMVIPKAPGLGVKLDEGRLARYAVGTGEAIGW